ncbi:DUF488 domain-containing protein [Thermoflavifilum thermophilum]|uniref:DUF488 domain-containing protein n=1 Tax=Thermoflavifilum thermophilum TaxID=1393122 RepID=A0A1I7NG56_9BACT|nr:DUF488 domain-containing protein [Thermoflavifilum thermophilum]SFV33654.1 Protein of unknown function, DUF488 [Thermoflavifilum thermophilum]
MALQKENDKSDTLRIFTIGHSVHPIDEFMALLKSHYIQLLVDIRSFPGSRFVPWFNAGALASSLSAAGIGYHLLRDLGGRRKAQKDSVNTGWRHPAFRGFADYMQTDAFARGLAALMMLSRRQQVCIMCAEAVPWRCHRTLVADALVMKGIEVLHIHPDGSLHAHQLTPFAQIRDGKLVYPADSDLEGN